VSRGTLGTMERVQCPDCRHDNVDANFCDRCGAALSPRVACGGCARLVVGGGPCVGCGLESAPSNEEEGWLSRRLPSWAKPSLEWPVLMRSLGVAMLVFAAANVAARALAENGAWSRGSIGRIAMLCGAGALLLSLRGGRILAMVAVTPFLLAQLWLLRSGFRWILAIETVALACVIVVLLQPGARAVLDRKNPYPVGPMPDWVSDVGALAVASLWVAPLNLLAMQLFGG
jgi:hypothetical protein